MSNAETPHIRIFRAGDFVSTEGTAVSFGLSDLQAIADGYDAAADPAPLVIGHPRLADPAYGWVDTLRVEGDVLIASPGRVEPSFAETVRSGRYAKVSAQFYTPDHPANPKPGGYYLKHVGFLGAAAPAVKGLGTVSLSEDEAGPLITIEVTPSQEARVNKDPKEISFAEREAELKTREDAIAAREKTAAETAAKARHQAHVSFAEALVAGAKLAPAGKGLLIGVLDALGNSGDAVVSFGEADGELAPTAALRKLFEGAQPLVSFGEAAKDDKSGDAGHVTSFAAPPGYDVDPEQAVVFNRARRLQDENPKLGFMDAVRRAQAA